MRAGSLRVLFCVVRESVLALSGVIEPPVCQTVTCGWESERLQM